MDHQPMFDAGVLVRTPAKSLSFDSGDEYFRLIFVTTGSTIDTHYVPDSYGSDYDRTEQAIHANAIEVICGEHMDWGTHMFMTVGQFMDWVHGIQFVLRQNPILTKKIMSDAEDEFCLTRFDGASGMKIANSVIRCARTILYGLNSGEFKLLEQIVRAIAQISDDYSLSIVESKNFIMSQIKTIADVDLFNISSNTDDELAAKKRRLQEKADKEAAESEAKSEAESEEDTASDDLKECE